MFHKMTIEDLDLRGKQVFCRVDFNVPLDENGKITDDTRIVAAVPSLQKILGMGAKLILASHLGRPKGQPNPKYSLAPVAPYLSKLIGRPVAMAPDCIGPRVESLIGFMGPGDVVLLENLRFHPGEEQNDPQFCQELAKLADVYVNDAFGTAHRAHASTEGVAHLLKPAVAGYLMEKELHYLGQLMEDPPRPFVAILGGAKVSDKITVINNLLPKINTLLIGGGMAYTFLKALDVPVGKSLVEADKLDLAKGLIEKAKRFDVKLLLPIDHIVANEFKADAEHKLVGRSDIPDDWMALDIGPETIHSYAVAISNAKTAIWNGPMGVFEFDAFAAGTMAMAQAMADTKGTTVIGGGDSVAAVNKSGLKDQMTHISTGGGASLEFLEGRTLPGVAALTDKP